MSFHSAQVHPEILEIDDHYHDQCTENSLASSESTDSLAAVLTTEPMKKWLLTFKSPQVEKQFMIFQCQRSLPMVRLGHLIILMVNLVNVGFLCVSSASRLPRSVGLLGATASLPLCAVVVGFIPFVCKKPWLFFLSSCFLSMITEILALIAVNFVFDALDGVPIALLIFFCGASVSMVVEPFLIVGTACTLICWAYEIIILCRTSYSGLELVRFLIVSVIVVAGGPVFIGASWYNDRAMRITWALELELKRANAALAQSNTELKIALGEMEEHAKTVLDLNSPIEKAIQIVANLKNLAQFGKVSTGKLRGSLAYLFALLSSSHFLAPDISQALDNNTFLAVDIETKRWLLTEVAGKNELHMSRPNSEAMRLSAVTLPCKMPIQFVNLTNWNFNVFEDLTDSPLSTLSNALFRKYLANSAIKVDFGILATFLAAVESAYHANPYHNALHATDVVQACGVFLEGGLREQLTDLDVLSLLFAASVHDVDHPGFNNGYQVNTKSQLALLYNDKSVLENHHLHVAFQILSEPDLNVWSHLTPQQWVDFRSTVIDLVLSTDMALHLDVISALKARVSSGLKLSSLKSNRADKLLVMKIALKAADISNVARPEQIYRKWTSNLTEEFFAQGDQERSQGLPVSAFMDREKFDLPKSQAGFIDYVAMPLWTEFTSLMGPPLSSLLDFIQKNRSKWC